MTEQKKQNLSDPKVRKRFVTYKEATELYSMGLTRVQEHAKVAGATYKMGNKVLVNTDIFEAYLEQFRIPGDLGADMFFMHPPYGAEIGIPYAGAEWGAEKVWTKENGKNKCTIIDHTDELIPTMGYNPKDYDLGRMPWDEFMKTLNKIVMKYYSAMDSGARMGILMGDVRRNGVLRSMLTDIVKPGALEQIIIKAQHNTVSERSGNTYHGNFVPLVHEYILVLKKLAPYILDFQFPKNCKLDIRDSEDATWRDVIAAVMDHLKEAYLEDIYNEIKDCKKAKNNPHYEAKVRQVLQQDKRYENVEKGSGYWRKVA